MAIVITLEGIDQAISNLNYRNRNTLKYKLLGAIRGFYENNGSVEALEGIDPDELIQRLWGTGDDPAITINKRKNLSSIRSSVNANLKRLYKDGENPEGIVIGPNNIFEMSDEAKENFLKSFVDGVKGESSINLSQITEVLSLVGDLISKLEDLEGSDEDSRKFDELKRLIQGLSQKVGLEEELGSDDYAESLDEGDPEEEFDEIEEIDSTEELDIEEVIEEIDADDELEVVEEIDGDGDLDVEEIFEDAEDEEDFEEIGPEDELEVVEEIDGDGDLDVEEILEDVDDEEDLEEIEIVEEADEGGLLSGNIEEGYSDGDLEEDEKIAKAQILAEEFNNTIAAMDRFYNQYILIPGDEYIVGNKQPKKDERIEQVVQLSPFYAGKFPVTNALFEIFFQKTGYQTTAEKVGYGTVYQGRFKKIKDKETGLEKFISNSTLITETVEGACWYQPYGSGSTLHNKRNHPVVQISLVDAMAFAAWTGKRLLTEDEWEAASRASKGYPLPWGNDWNKEDSCNIEKSNIGDTTPVDRFIDFENDFGIVDAMGNVLEWTMDSFEPPSSPGNGSIYNIVKGGSWISGDDVRLFSRFLMEPKSHSNILGFRCAAY